MVFSWWWWGQSEDQSIPKVLDGLDLTLTSSPFFVHVERLKPEDWTVIAASWCLWFLRSDVHILLATQCIISGVSYLLGAVHNSAWEAQFRTKIPLLMTPVHSSTSSPYTHSSCKTNTSICLLLNLLFKRDFPPTLAQGLQEHRWLFPSCCLFLLSLFEASSIPLRAPANANVNVNNRPAMVLVRRKALLDRKSVV